MTGQLLWQRRNQILHTDQDCDIAVAVGSCHPKSEADNTRLKGRMKKAHVHGPENTHGDMSV